VSLKKGKNTFSAVATNPAGNSSTASVSITYKPYVCKVPKVANKSPAAAKSAIKLAHCTVGKITRKHNARVLSGSVVSASPKSGTSHKAGTKVSLTVSSGPPPKP
jgi:beta-lactam-binding protein with PASTA domain